MTEYLIAFDAEWVPDHTPDELRDKVEAGMALVAETKAAGVFVFSGSLDDASPVVSVDASSGTPLFTDGSSSPRNLWEASPSWTSPTRRRRGSGRGGLRWPAAGHKRYDVSATESEPSAAIVRLHLRPWLVQRPTDEGKGHT